IQFVLRRGDFKRRLLVQIAQLRDFRMPRQRVVVEIHFRIERDEPPVAGHHQRIDFHQRRIRRQKRPIQRLKKRLRHFQNLRRHFHRQPQPENNFSHLIALQSRRRRNHFAQNRLRVFLHHFLDFHSARRARQNHWRFRRAIHQNAQIKFALDVQPFFNEQPPHRAPFRARLRRHQFHSQNLRRQFARLLNGTRQLHTSAFSASSGVNLRLHHHHRRPNFLRRRPCLLLLEHHFAPRNRHPELRQNPLRLILVYLHSPSSSAKIYARKKLTSLLR